MKGTHMARHGVRGDLVAYLDRNKNTAVHLDDLATAVTPRGEDPEDFTKPVQNCMSQLIRDGWHIEALVRGRTWRYSGPPDDTAGPDTDGVGACLEVIAVRRDGSLVCKSTSDEIYVAVTIRTAML